MLTSNFHTHTALCRHAKGEPKEYVECAIKSGLKKLGFADHAPYIFKSGYRSGIRMSLSDTENYVKTVLDLKNEYRKDIKIYLGFEMEYFPRYFDETFKFLSGFSPEYFILAQHFTKNEYDGVYSGRPVQTREDLKDYVDQVIEGLKTGLFSCLAHPDLITFDDKDYYLMQMKRICEISKQKDIPLEFNLLGFATKRQYPSKCFFKLANECGNTIIYGVDAHEPKALEECQQNAKSAEEFFAEFNLKRTENIKLLSGEIV